MSTHRPFRFGVLAAGASLPFRAWIDRVKPAEDVGYSTFLVVDHVGNHHGPFTELAAAAMAAGFASSRRTLTTWLSAVV